MKKGIFAMFILVASMAMVACTNANATNEGAVGENDAFKVLEKRREYYKEQDKEESVFFAQFMLCSRLSVCPEYIDIYSDNFISIVGSRKRRAEIHILWRQAV